MFCAEGVQTIKTYGLRTRFPLRSSRWYWIQLCSPCHRNIKCDLIRHDQRVSRLVVGCSCPTSSMRSAAVYHRGTTHLDLPVVAFTQEHVLKARGVVLHLPAVQAEPHLHEGRLELLRISACARTEDTLFSGHCKSIRYAGEAVLGMWRSRAEFWQGAPMTCRLASHWCAYCMQGVAMHASRKSDCSRSSLCPKVSAVPVTLRCGAMVL